MAVSDMQAVCCTVMIIRIRIAADNMPMRYLERSACFSMFGNLPFREKKVDIADSIKSR
jgi:hypothetical protein